PAYPFEGVAGDLHPLPYDQDAGPPPYVWMAIANDGSLAGYTQKYLRPTAAISHAGSVIELGTLPGYSYSSETDYIMDRNGSAFALGRSSSYTSNHALFWHDSTANDAQVHGSAFLDLAGE